VNFNTPALLFGLILLVASISLFIFGRLRPEIQRDSDSVYAIIGVVCALILFGSAFDLSLGMSFQQLLMIGALIALMWENIQARQPKNVGLRRGVMDSVRGWGSGKESRRGAPVMDDDRPVSRVYRAELEDLALLEDQRTATRRIRGGREGQDDDWEGTRRPARRDGTDDYADSYSETRRSRGALDESRPRRPRSERPASAPDRTASTPSWDEEEKPVRRPRLNSSDNSSRPPAARSSTSSRVERVRPPSSSRRRTEPSSDYVDYQPVDYPESGSPKDYE
jgi:Ycf66 protein N-terminus